MAEWMTVLQAARALGITKDAAKYRMKKLPAEMIRKDDNGRVLVSVSALAHLGENPVITYTEPGEPMQTHADPAGKPGENQVTPGEQNPAKPGFNPLLITVTKLETKLEVMDGLLEEKDKRIAALQAQIDKDNERLADLTKSLENVTQALTAAQALHAGTIQTELLEAATTEEIKEPQTAQPEEQAARPGIMKRIRSLFGK